MARPSSWSLTCHNNVTGSTNGWSPALKRWLSGSSRDWCTRHGHPDNTKQWPCPATTSLPGSAPTTSTISSSASPHCSTAQTHLQIRPANLHSSSTTRPYGCRRPSPNTQVPRQDAAVIDRADHGVDHLCPSHRDPATQPVPGRSHANRPGHRCGPTESVGGQAYSRSWQAHRVGGRLCE